MKKKLAILLTFAISLTLAACSGKKAQEHAVQEAQSAAQKIEAAQEVHEEKNTPETDSSGDNTDSENTGKDMTADEVYEVLRNDLGIDFSEYADDADGVIKDSTFFYVRLGISDTARENTETAIRDLCGEGSEAGSRKKPVLNNRLSEDFDKAELMTVFGYLRQGKDGAKTKSTEIYISEIDGKMNVFVFGTM